MGRAGVLKAQHAVRTVEAALTDRPVPAAGALRRRIEGVLAGAHELTELRLLGDLRTGELDLGDDDALLDAEQLLGVEGSPRGSGWGSTPTRRTPTCGPPRSGRCGGGSGAAPARWRRRTCGVRRSWSGGRAKGSLPRRRYFRGARCRCALGGGPCSAERAAQDAGGGDGPCPGSDRRGPGPCSRRRPSPSSPRSRSWPSPDRATRSRSCRRHPGRCGWHRPGKVC